MKKILNKLLVGALTTSLLLSSAVAFAEDTESGLTESQQAIIEQMAYNAAAYEIAEAAGDTDTMEVLYEANMTLASELAEGGTATYDEETDTWQITTATGTVVTSTSTENGKEGSLEYKILDSENGTNETVSITVLSAETMTLYLENGGTTDELIEAYNAMQDEITAAYLTGDTTAYGDDAAKTSATIEATLVGVLFGLSDDDVTALADALTIAKDAYNVALLDYTQAIADGDEEAAAEALERMNAANEANEEIRAEYGYTANGSEFNDGGYFIAIDPSSNNNSGSTSNSTVIEYKSITATAGNGGSISPSGITTVEVGEDLQYTITASTGYDIKQVLVDGVNVGAVKTYTFTDIDDSHIISASFETNGDVDFTSTSLTDASGFDLTSTDGTIKSGYGVYAYVTTSSYNMDNISVKATYNFGFGSTNVSLVQTSSNVWQFPVNSASPYGYRCIYIPVATADGSYTITYTITGYDVEGEKKTKTKTSTIVVKGVMYEDDFTSDSK